jgi:hypothetical protein
MNMMGEKDWTHSAESEALIESSTKTRQQRPVLLNKFKDHENASCRKEKK